MIDKVKPSAIEVEQLVLGMLMLESSCYYEVSGQLSKDLFYETKHQYIFDCITHLHDTGKSSDIVTVTNELKKRNQLETVGGAFYVTNLLSRIGSTAIIGEMTAILYQESIKRNLIDYSQELLKQSYDLSTDAFDVLNFATTKLESIENISSNDNFQEIADCLIESDKITKAKHEAYLKGVPPGIKTPLKKLNQLTGGWQNGDLIILAGRPGMGKTAVMLSCGLTAAESGTPVLIYSLEMSKHSLINRLIHSRSDITPDALKTGNLNQFDWIQYNDALTKLNLLPIYIDPKPVVNIRYIRNTARIMKMRNKCGMILIDYLQLINMASENKGRNREQEVSEVSRMCKIIAKELNVPVMLLSQLNRSVETSKDKRPTMAQLRESGSLEQDADMVILTYRPEYYDIKEVDGKSTTGYGELIVDKNREGATGIVQFAYNENLTKISDYIPESEPLIDPMKPNTEYIPLPF